MTLYKWSQTAASNATADTSINWQEGQSPSSVNDSARAMMASVAKHRDDIAGAIVTGGAATAYTVSSYQVFDTLARLNGQMIAFTPHTTNSDTVTLNVDGLGAKPLRSAPNVELVAGTLVQGTPYTALYSNADGAFYLRGYFTSPFNVPFLGGMDYWDTIAPNSAFIFPAGQAISRTVYARAFARWGTTYGVGDGSTTFNVPDKTGRFSAMKEAAASRLTSIYFGGNSANMGAVGGNEKNALSSLNQLPQFTPSLQSGSISGNAVLPVQGAWNGAGSVVSDKVSQGANNGGQFTLNVPFTTNSVSLTLNAIGSATPNSFATCPPTIVCNYIIRII
ncbi:tail fiber protein [Bradyrhizobium australiense]|uniref:Tail fiber protein n=1 Tax=Bradyrhizobium australiense TaxID=2721161 RepID=A0A7Y4GXH6_9BRAD|nr:tail fiber protein [Bradyrhizobium australiense]NOJ43761.1 tail fiber protein [Bradyrhizobium australiense]